MKIYMKYVTQKKNKFSNRRMKESERIINDEDLNIKY